MTPRFSRRWLLKTLAIAPALQVIARDARAGFGSAERTSIRHAAQAALALGDAELALAHAIRNGWDPSWPAAAAALVRVARDLGAVVHGLVGGIRQRADDTPLSRAEQLAEVWTHRSGALAESLQTAALAIVRVPGGQEPIDYARDELQKVDPTLAYAVPDPQPLLPGHDRPAVLGPHGEHAAYQESLFRATHYWRDAAVHWTECLRLMPGYRPADFAEWFGDYVGCVALQVRAACIVVGVPIGFNDTTQARLEGFDATCRLSQAGEWLWVGPDKQGAPQFYKAASVAWERIDPLDARRRRPVSRLVAARAVSREYRAVTRRVAESWFNSDLAIGGGFAFRNEPLRSTCGL